MQKSLRNKKALKLFNDVLRILSAHYHEPVEIQYCIYFKLRASVFDWARTMSALEVHLMFCYNEFWIYVHICSLFKSILLYRGNKIMLTAIPIQFILYLYEAATFQRPEGGRLIRGRTVSLKSGNQQTVHFRLNNELPRITGNWHSFLKV